MKWMENIQKWRQLSETEKLRRRWEAIPLDVAQSMAFEKEPVEIDQLREILSRIDSEGFRAENGASAKS